MTPLLVLCYLIYTIFTSIILSIRLALRRRRCAVPSKEMGNVVALYEGTVYHGRRHPARNSFRFPARYELIDLDRPPYSPQGFLTADYARKATCTTGPVLLLRIPPSVGYERSPVNIYYCYDIEGSSRILKKCMVEASNTPWGQSVTFVFNPSFDSVPKSEYISPFMDMLGNWRLKVNDPGETLYAIISVQHPEFGNYFTASFTAKRIATKLDHESFFWLMPHKVSLMAYWNALKLWWKNVPFYDHPIKENPFYREEAVSRVFGKTMMQSCGAFQTNICGANNNQEDQKIDRCFIWKDIKWPWSWC
ncbi:uncharacterized protein LOC127253046 [Andrographis paniculata]|uniref:uncharacterized protein LOC127253046 n=1 Tax=Andrographis paniculata TaxID=175694 RepID=UPI0021E7EB4D|nr:uncharacterized protein LOC127253046 [Andrographis paniculata]